MDTSKAEINVSFLQHPQQVSQEQLIIEAKDVLTAFDLGSVPSRANPNDSAQHQTVKEDNMVSSSRKFPPFIQARQLSRNRRYHTVGLKQTREVEYPLSSNKILMQPETRPISHDQLVAEVKGIYVGLTIVEAKCINVDETLTSRDVERQLTDSQWQALIALHKTLLHEHHDFFLASRHPSASSKLSIFAANYSIPRRIWRYGLHACLVFLTHQLPNSLDHILSLIHIACSVLAPLYEKAPKLEDTWIKCLRDISRYWMAIYEDRSSDREIWSGISQFRYGKAADKNPTTGRLYHHLALLVRPHIISQLFLYTRSLMDEAMSERVCGSIKTLVESISNRGGHYVKCGSSNRGCGISRRSIITNAFLRWVIFLAHCHGNPFASEKNNIHG